MKLPTPIVRAEYLGFQDVDEHREFRFHLCWPDGPTEVRVRVATAAFNDGRVRLQDGPDVCYQKLLLAVAGGVIPDAITIDDADLVGHRAAHTKAPRHRAGWKPPSPDASAVAPRKPFRTRTPARPLSAAPPVKEASAPRLQEGQRVSHAAFGIGVTTSSGSGHTVITFDEGGPKRFITSMLDVQVLSPPRTWETGPRGKNRPCKGPAS